MVKALIELVGKPLVEVVRDLIGRKLLEGKAKHDAKMKALADQSNWEAAQAEASRSSWKDEWFAVLLSVPVVVVFYGVVAGDQDVFARLEYGLAVLSDLPEWYQVMLGIAVSASFGIRGVNSLKERKGK